MNENDAIRIASELIARSNLDPCSFESIQRFARSDIPAPSTERDEWVVRFAFEMDEDVAATTEVAIVVVDDATGEAYLMDSL